MEFGSAEFRPPDVLPIGMAVRFIRVGAFAKEFGIEEKDAWVELSRVGVPLITFDKGKNYYFNLSALEYTLTVLSRPLGPGYHGAPVLGGISNLLGKFDDKAILREMEVLSKLYGDMTKRKLRKRLQKIARELRNAGRAGVK